MFPSDNWDHLLIYSNCYFHPLFPTPPIFHISDPSNVQFYIFGIYVVILNHFLFDLFKTTKSYSFEYSNELGGYPLLQDDPRLVREAGHATPLAITFSVPLAWRHCKSGGHIAHIPFRLYGLRRLRTAKDCPSMRSPAGRHLCGKSNEVLPSTATIIFVQEPFYTQRNK